MQTRCLAGQYDLARRVLHRIPQEFNHQEPLSGKFLKDRAASLVPCPNDLVTAVADDVMEIPSPPLILDVLPRDLPILAARLAPRDIRLSNGRIGPCWFRRGRLFE